MVRVLPNHGRVLRELLSELEDSLASADDEERAEAQHEHDIVKHMLDSAQVSAQDLSTLEGLRDYAEAELELILDELEEVGLRLEELDFDDPVLKRFEDLEAQAGVLSYYLAAFGLNRKAAEA